MSLRQKTYVIVGMSMLNELSNQIFLFEHEELVFFLILTVMMGLGFFLDWHVLSRLIQLEKGVHYITASKNWVVRLPHSTDDELGRVTMAINHMLDEIGESNRALREERNFVTAVLNTVGVLVVVADSHGHIVQINHRCEELTGYTALEVIGQTIWPFLIRSEDTNRWQQLFKSLIAGDYP